MDMEEEDKMIGEAVTIALRGIADKLTCGKAELSIVYVKDEHGDITAQARTKIMMSLAVMRDPSLLPTDILKLAGGHPLNISPQKELREAIKDVYEDIMLNEDTKYDDAESVAVKLGEILLDNPPTKAEQGKYGPVPTGYGDIPAPSPAKDEPLAVLAARKGFRSVRIWPYRNGGCAVDVWADNDVLVGHEGKDYNEAESKARAYLNGLPDKEAK